MGSRKAGGRVWEGSGEQVTILEIKVRPIDPRDGIENGAWRERPNSDVVRVEATLYCTSEEANQLQQWLRDGMGGPASPVPRKLSRDAGIADGEFEE